MKKVLHTFHIPVMGLGYTVDTPAKVARFGITSVVSIIEDDLMEQMREFYCRQTDRQYLPIPKKDVNHRARRITAYLNLLSDIVEKQTETLKASAFEKGSEIAKYFELLPDNSDLKKQYREMLAMEEGFSKEYVQDQLRNEIQAGDIDVNIMTKIDRQVYDHEGNALPPEYSDAMAALRGFAECKLDAAVVLSAGLNPRLYAYIESFPDFFPDGQNKLKKRIILKVSDYRSALIQGKFLAKKGVWVSEYRVESGLNCGGHAFATDGLLLGPIMEEFKNKKQDLVQELFGLYTSALISKGKKALNGPLEVKISVQGGIGTASEDKFLREYYQADLTGWGSPFLLVPEATNVDEHTLDMLVHAKKEDYFLSYASPLGIPFNNFRPSTSEEQRKARIAKERPGSPCYKEFLSTNTEFTEKPICTASRQYQKLKLEQIDAGNLPPLVKEEEKQKIMEKDCLCEGLGMSVLLKDHITHPKKLEAVAICPGPNLAYFSKIATLEEMVGHIYGRLNLLNNRIRPSLFINELDMYIDYFKNELTKFATAFNDKKGKQLDSFKSNLLEGIAYYKELTEKLKLESSAYKSKMMAELVSMEAIIRDMIVPVPVIVS
ncbi:MAG: hypothetical protein ACHQRM_14280 [Bacteroidia bacterium]